MALPADAPDCWVKLHERGLPHFVAKGERTTACGLAASNAVNGMRAQYVTDSPDYERPKRCAPCLREARKLGYK